MDRGSPASDRVVTCVCTANICRSPIAEKLLAHGLAAEKEPLRSLTVISSGVSAVEGEPASANSIKALSTVGLDLSQHRSRRFSRQVAERSLVIFCMTDSHRFIITQLYPDLEAPVHLFRGFMVNAEQIQIPDPFGMNLGVYEACRDSIVEAMPSLMRYLRKEIRPKLLSPSDA